MENFDSTQTPSEKPSESNVERQETKNIGKRYSLPLKRGLRILAGVLILIGLGILIAIFSLYIPTQKKLNATKVELAETSEKCEANLQSMQKEVQRLEGLGEKNQDLQVQLSKAQLQITLLQVHLDVTSAQLVLANKDSQQAREALGKTTDRLKSLEALIHPDQREILGDLLERLKLILGELDMDIYAAQSDLNVFLNSLEKLETKNIP